MSPVLHSSARQLADELSGGNGSWVVGPLKGYHHETYVLSLPGKTRVVKIREPRGEILWFDRRCFRSEEELLCALSGYISRIPGIIDMAGMRVQGFIEGEVLPMRRWTGSRVPDVVFDQIVDLFRQMVPITPDMLAVERRCERYDRPENGDCDGFLERLIVFMENHVYHRNRAEFGPIFEGLGIGDEAFDQLRKSVSGLVERDFCLLHADLHRNNFILDPLDQLWAIDWELAMMGDPLYDLATHLYLMRYPADQERRMAQEWSRAVHRVRPRGASGWEQDLERILDFKRAQSVFTDVIRVSLSLREGRDGSGCSPVRLLSATRKLQSILAAAAGPLGLTEVPSRSRIAAALVR
ncbi:phosphotransferase [Streptomyces sp. NPDC005492]|uniref:phosphotransferase n=1 Tax=Streptomyces sp. NPDC005492 TaxID=3156883 RepID=UPI0033B0728E